VEQDQAAVGELGELLDVFDDGSVGWGAVERYEDGFVHAIVLPRQFLAPRWGWLSLRLPPTAYAPSQAQGRL